MKLGRQATIDAIMRIVADSLEYEVGAALGPHGDKRVTLSADGDVIEMSPDGARWLGGVLEQTTGDDFGLVAMANACAAH